MNLLNISLLICYRAISWLKYETTAICVTCQNAGVILMARMTGITDAWRSRREGSFETAWGRSRTLSTEKCVEFSWDPGRWGERRSVAGGPPTTPCSGATFRVIPGRPTEWHWKGSISNRKTQVKTCIK